MWDKIDELIVLVDEQNEMIQAIKETLQVFQEQQEEWIKELEIGRL